MIPDTRSQGHHKKNNNTRTRASLAPLTRFVPIHCSQPPFSKVFSTTNTYKNSTFPRIWFAHCSISSPDHRPEDLSHHQLHLDHDGSALYNGLLPPEKPLHPPRLSAPTGSTKHKQCTLLTVSRGSSSSLVKEGMSKRPSYTPARRVCLPFPSLIAWSRIGYGSVCLMSCGRKTVKGSAGRMSFGT